VALIDWLARDNPGVALDIWNHAGRPALPAELLNRTAAQWCPRLTDTKAEPAPEARAAVGRWLGALDLDHRPGTGLRADGVPDIDWVRVADFEIGRYLVTNRQWQAFIDDVGYETDRWWDGLAECMAPQASSWSEPTAPRETVSWYEAMAYCRWLSVKLGQPVALPTKRQWERVTRDISGRAFAWRNKRQSDLANVDHQLRRTTVVGLYPDGAMPEGVQDLIGNVWEWCLNEFEQPQNIDPTGSAPRVVRGGSWLDPLGDCYASFRFVPDSRNHLLGLRLVRRRVPHSAP
jgi:formylglycine-generating enzyme required for sulfatase activity